MTDDTIKTVDQTVQAAQPWTAPSLMRLDAGDAEANGGGGPDFASEAS